MGSREDKLILDVLIGISNLLGIHPTSEKEHKRRNTDEKEASREIGVE
jgi:hypothetical protein